MALMAMLLNPQLEHPVDLCRMLEMVLGRRRHRRSGALGASSREPLQAGKPGVITPGLA
jgi:hypothetical protein